MIKYQKVCDNCGHTFEYIPKDKKTGNQLLWLTLDHDINVRDVYTFCPVCGYHNLVKKGTQGRKTN